MYVLDTNAFYYAAGISECTYDVEKLQKLVDENEVFISSTSLFEFLIKFRNDIQTIHKGGKYLWEKKIKLAGNVINPLPNNFTGDIINLTESELQTLCSNILENKIDAESRFISILFDMCLFSGFYFSAMSDGVEPSGFCFEVFEKAFRMFANINLNRFSALRFMEVNGYLPTRVRVFTDENNAFKPQILTEAIHMELDGLDMEKVYAYKEANDNDELYKYLFMYKDCQ